MRSPLPATLDSRRASRLLHRERRLRTSACAHLFREREWAAISSEVADEGRTTL